MALQQLIYFNNFDDALTHPCEANVKQKAQVSPEGIQAHCALSLIEFFNIVSDAVLFTNL